ncbi:MAG: HAD family hydrolase [Desulfococcaceae bacterium]
MKALIVDLDGTLVHAEPGEIPVPGFSGCRYMALRSADLLAEISQKMPVLIATGRNAKSVGGLTDQLENIFFSGFVLENGMVARTSLYADTENPVDEWAEIAQHFPDWRRISGYENCLGLAFDRSEENPGKRVREVLDSMGKTAHLYQEPGKIFVYPYLSGKLSGIQVLGFEPHIVLGDDINDLDMLSAAGYSATMASAHEKVRHLVMEKGNYCSEFSSHKGTEDLLLRVGELISGNAETV